MANSDQIPRKPTVVLHARVSGSSELVRQNEALAHERIQGALGHLSTVIEAYRGATREVRGDVLIAAFDRVSDAVCAALDFQARNTQFNTLYDTVRPEVCLGITPGEAISDGDTLKDAGVLFAQSLAQLASAGAVCIPGAVYEAVPGRLPFEFEDLGEREIEGFPEPVRVYAVGLEPGDADLPSDHLKTVRMVASFEASISRDPEDHSAYFNLGLWWHWKSKYRDAIEFFDKAIEINSRFPWALCARAGLRATCPDSRYRDGAAAMVDAQKALELAAPRGHLDTEWVHRIYLQTLAAAYAEAGDFDTAVDHQRKVLDLCVTRTAKKEASPRLEKYQSRKPIQEEAGLITNNPAWLCRSQRKSGHQ